MKFKVLGLFSKRRLLREKPYFILLISFVICELSIRSLFQKYLTLYLYNMTIITWYYKYGFIYTSLCGWIQNFALLEYFINTWASFICFDFIFEDTRSIGIKSQSSLGMQKHIRILCPSVQCPHHAKATSRLSGTIMFRVDEHSPCVGATSNAVSQREPSRHTTRPYRNELKWYMYGSEIE